MAEEARAYNELPATAAVHHNDKDGKYWGRKTGCGSSASSVLYCVELSTITTNTVTIVVNERTTRGPGGAATGGTEDGKDIEEITL